MTWLYPEGEAAPVASKKFAGCGWLVGEVTPPLEPGVWDFHAPSFGSNRDGNASGRPALTFRINPTATTGSPASKR